MAYSLSFTSTNQPSASPEGPFPPGLPSSSPGASRFATLTIAIISFATRVVSGWKSVRWLLGDCMVINPTTYQPSPAHRTTAYRKLQHAYQILLIRRKGSKASVYPAPPDPAGALSPRVLTLSDPRWDALVEDGEVVEKFLVA